MVSGVKAGWYKDILLEQVYQEVQAWEAPSPGLRGMVMLGTMTLPAQVPAPATLPAALPPSDAEHLEHPLAPLPVVRQANGCDTIQGTFFEVCTPHNTSSGGCYPQLVINFYLMSSVICLAMFVW
jgi:hypothetical protein